MNNTAAEFIRKILDIIGSEQTAATAKSEPHVVIVNQPPQQVAAEPETKDFSQTTPKLQPVSVNPFPEDDHTSDETGGIMVPPLQQKMELLKKVAGVDSVYDKPGEGDDSDDEVAIMKRNAGLPMMTMVASEDEDGLEN